MEKDALFNSVWERPSPVEWSLRRTYAQIAKSVQLFGFVDYSKGTRPDQRSIYGEALPLRQPVQGPI